MQHLWLVLLLIPFSRILANSSPIDETWDQKKRIDFLSTYFNPKPGHEVLVENKSIVGDEKKKALSSLDFKGFIEVNPPTGLCFTIHRRLDLEDQRVCSFQRLSFRAQDLDPDGMLNWEVSTGEKDFGTELHWPTPYRYVRVTDESMSWPGPSRIKVLSTCKSLHSQSMGRRILLGFLDGDEWTVALPAQDLLAAQPTKPLPNLFIQTPVSSSGGFIKVETAQEIAAKKKAKAGIRGPHGELVSSSAESIDERDPNKIKAPWQIHPRNAYEMAGSNFKGTYAPPDKMNSVCHYKYDTEQLAHDGELECHNVAGFKWFYGRIPCLKDLDPHGAKASAPAPRGTTPKSHTP